MLELRVLLGMTLLTVSAAVVMKLSARRWSAAERHSVWSVTLLLVLLLPLLLRLEPPAVVFRGSTQEVQRFVVWVGSAEAPQPSIAWPSTKLLAALWLSGALGVAGWWLLGFVRVAGMVAASKEHSTHAGVAVRTCAGLRMPAVAAGPVILLPEASAAWPLARLQMVLAHELAHVRRRDLWWRLAGTLACCLFWFHPLAWWAAAQQRKESEMACDDLVLRTYPSAAYAEQLVGVAREASGYPTPAAVMAMAKPRELEKRLVAVLDSERRRGSVSSLRLVLTCVVALLAVFPLLAWQDSSVQMKGSVKDMVGAIPGAKLLLKGTSDYTFETGSDGTYSVTGLPEGEYTIEVLKPGYAALTIGKRRVEIGKTVRADFHLQLGGLRETVNVAGYSTIADSPTPSAPQRIRISGNVQAAKLLHRLVPSYPREAKEARVEGTVRLSAIVGKEGDVVRLTLLMSPSAELARSAMEAVRQWKYQPTLLNGNPVEIETAVDVNYTLTK
jgi:TonB family protein